MTATLSATDRYTIISADCHAGGEPRDVPRVPRSRVPRRLRRVAQQVQEPVPRPAGRRPRPQLGQRAPHRRPRARRHRRRGRVPEHGAAVLPELRAVRAAADARASTSTGSPGSAPTTAGSPTGAASYPERRAGIGQIFLNDVDDAIDDVKWIKEHGLRGGVLISAIPPDVDYVQPLYDPEYDRLWKVCEDLEVPINAHGGTGAPELRQVPGREPALHHRGQLLLAAAVRAVHPVGRVRAVPEAQVRHDRAGLRVDPADAAPARRGDRPDPQDRPHRRARVLATSTSCRGSRREYFAQNCYVGVSQPGKEDAAARYEIGLDHFMWGSDYPHDEGTAPYTREHLRQLFHDTDPAELQQLLAGNAAARLRLRPRRARAARREGGPDRRGDRDPARQAPRQPQRGAAQGFCAS